MKMKMLQIELVGHGVQQKAARARWVLGAIVGTVPVAGALSEQAGAVAREFFAKAKAEEFSGNLVDEVWSTGALPPRDEWFPHEDVHSLGFAPAVDESNQMQILATAGG